VHPNYQSSIGPWHDWAMVTFAEDGEDDTLEDVMQKMMTDILKMMNVHKRYYGFCC